MMSEGLGGRPSLSGLGRSSSSSGGSFHRLDLPADRIDIHANTRGCAWALRQWGPAWQGRCLAKAAQIAAKRGAPGSDASLLGSSQGLSSAVPGMAGLSRRIHTKSSKCARRKLGRLCGTAGLGVAADATLRNPHFRRGWQPEGPSI